MKYVANSKRYDNMIYNYIGNSGLKTSAISLGLWQNFGGENPYEESKKMLLGAFDMGINHIDIANNYGPPAGSAEDTFGKVLKEELYSYRDELLITSKAGFYMWEGPFGDWGSKKYLISSLNQSLKRTGLDYFDIFYHHRPDPNTPLEETMDALKQMLTSGKALYVGISNYSAKETEKAIKVAEKMNIKLLIHQVRYSMFERTAEENLFNVLEKNKIGAIAYSPLAQGMLTDKYFNQIPEDSRVGKKSISLTSEAVTKEKVEKAKLLNTIAKERGQKLSQMALAWVMRNKCMSSVLIGASSLEQIKENIDFMKNINFTKEELEKIEEILKNL